MSKTGTDDDDPFSLDFTKISLDEEPAPAPAPQPTLARVSEPAKVAVEPPKPAPAAPAAEAPSAFASFDSPLELLDFASMSAEPAVETPVPAVPAKEKPKAAAAAQSRLPRLHPKPAPQTELLLDIARQHAAGKTAEASGALEAALRAGTLGKATEQGWGMLFDLLQILNRRQAFENLADAYAKRFEKSAPAWLDASGEVDESLESGGAAYVALSGILSASSEGALKKLVEIAGSNPTVRLGLLKVTDAGNDGCRLLAGGAARHQEAGPRMPADGRR